MKDRLISLRIALTAQKLDGFILPVNDEFMGEYVPGSAQRLTWLTGFTGSAGMVVILKDRAAFFTDGRYTLQAEAEVKDYALFNSGETTPEKWIAENASTDAVIGYDPKLHTLSALQRFEEQASNVKWHPASPNPVDALWKDRPKAPASAVRIQPLEFAGEESSAKRARIAKVLKAKKIDVAILSAPDSICWLLNIRGNDVPFTPFVLAYALLHQSGALTLYLDGHRLTPEVKTHLGADVTVKSPDSIVGDIEALEKKRVLYDPQNSPVWFYQELAEAGAEIIESADPCKLPKAQKNKAELDGMRAAHIRDGLAVTKFLHWLSGQQTNTLTEMDVAAQLETFRKSSNLYLEPSFTTIAGSGPNGAVIHYRVTNETNRKLDNNSMLLLDSGGQYMDGTTDITRTVAIGLPSAEMKDRFTRVLKGHIALASAVFPEGTTGSQLDALARQYLWQVGLDYDHGTGHGVGSYLSVHEGPQRISKRGGDAALIEGMTISNEPGYYKAGEYGIRIESLVVVLESKMKVEGKRMLEFETITLAPIDMRLIDRSLLTPAEEAWLKAYHRKVCDMHMPHLGPEEAQWLRQMT